MATNPTEAPHRIVLTTLAFEGGLAVLAIVVGALFGYNPWTLIEWNPRGMGLGLAATLPLVLVLFLSTKWPVGPLRELRQVVHEVIVPLFRNCSISQLLLISMMAGVGEELLFRGLLQFWLTRASDSPGLGLALASLVFGLAHPITRTYAVLAGLIGMYLGWLWLASGNLLTPIVTHAAYDFVALVYLVRGRHFKDASTEPAQEPLAPPPISG